MASGEAVEKALKQYSERRSIYAALATKVEDIIREVLESQKINYHSISSRAKGLSSYERKASEEKYNDPINEIKDMAGVRVITYIQSEASATSEVVNGTFEVDRKHSVDKAEELGTDRLGYHSVHFICTLGQKRSELPENKIFDGVCFEIQVRTILQHAWAEFEHDRNYQFAGVLPRELKRRVLVLSGNLELVDREFESVATEIEKYAVTVEKKAESGDLALPIDSASLVAYLKTKFTGLISKGVVPTLNKADADVVEELHTMGITKLEQLDKIVPPGLGDAEIGIADSEMVRSFVGLLRHIMIIRDPDLYFGKAWKHHWSMLTPNSIEIYKKFGVDINKYAQKYRLEIAPRSMRRLKP